MEHKYHCENSFKLFGEKFKKVHEDLDKTAIFTGNPHRKDTHYFEYVLGKVADGEWNLNEARAALHHIIDDCGQIMLQDDWIYGSEKYEVVQQEWEKSLKKHGPKGDYCFSCGKTEVYKVFRCKKCGNER